MPYYRLWLAIYAVPNVALCLFVRLQRRRDLIPKRHALYFVATLLVFDFITLIATASSH